MTLWSAHRSLKLSRRLALALIALVSLVSASSSSAAAPVGATTVYRLAPGSHAWSMTPGPDGSIWFAGISYSFGGSAGLLGRIGPTGQVTEFPLPATGSHYPGATSIAVGPDAALWFTDRGGNKVGRITADGDIREFALPERKSRPNAIVAGADGNLWFTEGAGRIGRITPAGQITEFSLPHHRGPAGIVAGPDGNLWFTESIPAAIGRITPRGAVTQFALPNSKSKPGAIAVGADGNLWFVEKKANFIGRLTPAGRMSQFRIPAHGGTFALAAGPAGEIWLTSGRRLVRANVHSISNGRLITHVYCIATGCNLVADNLAMGLDGDVWFGGGRVESVEGGGGTQIESLYSTPGFVGKFTPESRVLPDGTP